MNWGFRLPLLQHEYRIPSSISNDFAEIKRTHHHRRRRRQRNRFAYSSCFCYFWKSSFSVSEEKKENTTTTDGWMGKCARFFILLLSCISPVRPSCSFPFAYNELWRKIECNEHNKYTKVLFSIEWSISGFTHDRGRQRIHEKALVEWGIIEKKYVYVM